MSFDDEFDRRAAQLALLDEGHEEDGDIAGYDELEFANQVAQQSGNAGPTQLDEKVSIRDQRWQALVDQAPFSRINPPSVLQGTIGGQQQVTVGENKQVVLWGGDDAETLPCTVTLAPVQQIATDPNNIGVVNPIRPYGRVKWGTRGWLNEAVIDIGRGCQFTVNASYVSVQVGLDPVPEGAGFQNPTMLLSGQMSFYPTTHKPALTRTVYSTNDGSTTGLIDVPAFARGVMVTSPLAAGSRGDLEVVFYDSSFNTRYTFYYPPIVAGVPVPPLDYIPLSGDITAIAINSTSFVEDYNDVIFELAF